MLSLRLFTSKLGHSFFLPALSVILFAASSAKALPEMARLGYQNCNSCHVSPTGGGVLTAYGRAMAADILSTWSYSGEETLDHGLVRGKDGEALRTPDWLQIGGDSRWIQTYINNDQATQMQSFPMENELEAAVQYLRAWFVGNVAIQGGPPGSKDYGILTSERLYGMVNLTDQIYIRAGKFQLPFGINQPNHMAVIANDLGWGANTESDNLEVGYIGQKYNAILTADFGRPDNTSLQTERGVALNLAYNLGVSHKLGWAVFSGTSNTSHRLVTGPYITLGFWRKLVLLSQFDIQWQESQNPSQSPEQRGFVTLNRLQYQVFKGVQPYIVQQISYLNTEGLSSRYDSIGAGVMFFPRPHFEFWLEWDKERRMALSPHYTDSAFATAHYYF